MQRQQNGGWWLYVLRRVLAAVFVMWAAFTVTFIILYLVPGDPALLIVGGDGGVQATPEQLAAVRAEYGFDQPVIVQYLQRLAGVMSGDFGVSYQMRQPVASLIADQFGSTLALAMFALVVAVVGGLLVGGLAAYTKSRWITQLLDSLPPLGASLPTFWVGLVLMQAFCFQLGWFPSAGERGFESLVLPGITMAIPGSASIAQVFAKSLRSSSRDDYVTVARAKGVGRARVFISHAARNALLPTITVAGMIVAGLFAYSAITETIFSRAGMGMALDNAVQSKDIPMVSGIVLVIAAVFVITNLIVDLIYPTIDPRLRTASGSRAVRQQRELVEA
jgi:peptide/nickel transport system permease protein